MAKTDFLLVLVAVFYTLYFAVVFVASSNTLERNSISHLLHSLHILIVCCTIERANLDASIHKCTITNEHWNVNHMEVF